MFLHTDIDLDAEKVELRNFEVRLVTDEQLATAALILLKKDEWFWEDDGRCSGGDSQIDQMLEAVRERCKALGCLMPLFAYVDDPSNDFVSEVVDADQARAVIEHLQGRFDL